MMNVSTTDTRNVAGFHSCNGVTGLPGRGRGRGMGQEVPPIAKRGFYAIFRRSLVSPARALPHTTQLENGSRWHTRRAISR